MAIYENIILKMCWLLFIYFYFSYCFSSHTAKSLFLFLKVVFQRDLKFIFKEIESRIDIWECLRYNKTNISHYTWKHIK